MQVYHRLHVVEEEEKGGRYSKKLKKKIKVERPHTHMGGRGDDMKDSNLSQNAGVCEDEDTTTLPKKCARRSVDAVASVRIVRCHAIMDDVIDVRIVECHASIHVVIGIRVVFCHPLIDFHFSGFFHFVPKFSSCCHVVAIHHHFPCSHFAHVLHRIDLSFEVWYLHTRRLQ